MYLDSLEFLEEERDAWAPFETLSELTDEQLAVPVAGAHGWSGRDLMGHLVACQSIALQVATELAVNETSPTKARTDADWDARGGEAVNAEIDATWAARPMAELREQFRTVPGEMRGYLTVVPESRWLKHAEHQRFLLGQTTTHYEEHSPDLEAILAAAIAGS
ncbi:MAG: maleylpyruvate isomerase N-terminal domain-containing protein [Chloroflexota bacterium]